MTHDIAIIGGGVIGCAIAHSLSRARAGRVVVLERAAPGSEASGAAAGVLAVASSRAPGGALFELRRKSAGLFPSLATELREQTGIDVEYRPTGLVEVAFDGGEAAQLERLAERRREQGFAVELLDPQSLRALEPRVSAEARGGALFADDRSINNQRLVEALHQAAERLGVEFRFGAPLRAVESVAGRVTAIEAGSERWSPGVVVVAAGVWSRDIGELLGFKVPVRPDRGEMVALRAPFSLQRTLVWGEGYLVGRHDGEILVGSTSARGVFEKSVSAESVALLLERALRIVPELRDSSLVRTWAGLRPCPTIRRPIIGPPRGYDNVILATGHHRSGILLAPITAQLVTEMILGAPTSVDVQPFCYRPR